MWINMHINAIIFFFAWIIMCESMHINVTKTLHMNFFHQINYQTKSIDNYINNNLITSSYNILFAWLYFKNNLFITNISLQLKCIIH
jgi:hypothetical protein